MMNSEIKFQFERVLEEFRIGRHVLNSMYLELSKNTPMERDISVILIRMDVAIQRAEEALGINLLEQECEGESQSSLTKH